LTQVPSFKSEDEQPTLIKARSVDKLRPEDFGRRKLDMLSPAAIDAPIGKPF
jgi:hypothetical protein